MTSRARLARRVREREGGGAEGGACGEVHWALWAGERRVSCGRRPLTSVASACQQQLLLLLRRPAGSLIYT